MRKRPVILIPIILIIIGITFYFVFFRKTANPDEIKVSGNIEATESQIAFKIPGRLLERDVDEGSEVKKDQLIAKLDAKDQEISVSQAEANVSLAQATLDELLAGSRPEDIARSRAAVSQAQARLNELKNGTRVQDIASAQSDVDRAEAAVQSAQSALDLANTQLDRYTTLFNEGAVSAQDYDKVKNQRDTAQAALDQATAAAMSARDRLNLLQAGTRPEQIQQAQASLEQAQASYQLVLAGPRPETIQQARARVDIANQGLAQAQQVLGYASLFAPFDGVVTSKSAEPGEYLNPGSTVVTIAQINEVDLRAYISETDLGKVHIGQEVQVTTDSYPGKVYTGTIRFISSNAEFTPKSVQTREERVKLVYLIKINLSNPNYELKPGMPADAIINLQK
jgi:HlyD family secretion protein